MDCALNRLDYLRGVVERQVPLTAGAFEIWGHLGWDSDASIAYPIARAYGVDLRPLLAPDFAEIISIVVDGAYGFPYARTGLTWTGILQGEVPAFNGSCPKERLLAVIDCAKRSCSL